MCIRHGEKTQYGCNQDWYKVEWRRRAGCGPVAAANILIHLRKRYGADRIPYGNSTMDEALAAMDDIFAYVRPCLRGLNTVRKFVDGMGKFGRNYGLSFKYRYIVVPPQAEIRPNLDEVVRFIEEGLRHDVPVAFLNLHAGAVEDSLSSWHWVTIVGIDSDADADADADEELHSVTIRFYDQANSLEVDLGKWLNSTKRGGGFTYFYGPSNRQSYNGHK
jgi:hypothetical protein